MADTTLSTTGDIQADRPDIPSPAYNRMKKRWKRCRDLMGGTDAIHDGGEEYLPKLEGETDDGYDVRSRLCAVYNGYKRTVIACVGLIMQKPPVMGDDMPSQLTALAENITGGGKHLSAFTFDLVNDAIIDGESGILVEYPRAQEIIAANPTAVSQAAVDNPTRLSDDDTSRLGLRPYFIEVKAEDIIKRLYAKVNGVTKLVLLSIREVTEERVPPFGIRAVTRYRVYLRETAKVTCQVWKVPPSGGDGTKPTIENVEIVMRNLEEVPFELLVAGERKADNETAPALIDLADLNIEHHQVKTEIRNLCALACIPTPVRTGAVPVRNSKGEMEYPSVQLGPRNTIEVPAGPGNGFAWTSPDVTVVEPHKKNLEDIKADMGSSGLAFLAPDTRAAETAEAKRIDAAAQNATLGTLASNLKDRLEGAFGHAAAYMGLKSGSVTVNTDFEGTVMDAQTMQAYGYLAAQGKLSLETLLSELERGKRLTEGFDIQAEIKRIHAADALPVDPSDPNKPRGNTPPNDNANTGT